LEAEELDNDASALKELVKKPLTGTVVLYICFYITISTNIPVLCLSLTFNYGSRPRCKSHHLHPCHANKTPNTTNRILL
jgi:hypothetical protein